MLTRVKGKGNPHLLLVGLQRGVTTMGFSVENDKKAESSPTIKHKYSTLLHTPKGPDILHKYSTPLHVPKTPDILYKYTTPLRTLKGPICYLSIPIPKDLIFHYKDMFYCHSLDNNKEMEQPECPLTDECVMKISYTVEFYSAAKENKTLQLTGD